MRGPVKPSGIFLPGAIAARAVRSLTKVFRDATRVDCALWGLGSHGRSSMASRGGPGGIAGWPSADSELADTIQPTNISPREHFRTSWLECRYPKHYQLVSVVLALRIMSIRFAYSWKSNTPPQPRL